jgi:hypothetical protein
MVRDIGTASWVFGSNSNCTDELQYRTNFEKLWVAKGGKVPCIASSKRKIRIAGTTCHTHHERDVLQFKVGYKPKRNEDKKRADDAVSYDIGLQGSILVVLYNE